MLALTLLASAADLAVTVDDLPWNAGPPPGTTRAEAVARLVSTLEARRVPAVGFVNCARVSDPAELSPWVAARMELGNHGAHHLDLSTQPLDTWSADAAHCHDALVGWFGASRWFRFPYLHQGETLDKRDGAYAAVAAMGERVAHVSIDNYEWKYAARYASAARASERATIGADYVAHMAEAAAHFRDLARRKLGRDIKHVLLLHANALNADHGAAMLDRLAAEGWRFISLDEALADPVYALPDTWVSPNGPSWLHRVAPPLPGELDWERRAAGW